MAPEPEATVQKRVLVFEDDETDGQVYARIFRGAGYHVDLSHHFSTALAAFENERPPDLLVADIVVPKGEVNGIALARMATIRCHAIKIIHVTGFDLAGAERELLGPLLRKPISTGRLLSEAHRLLAA